MRRKLLIILSLASTLSSSLLADEPLLRVQFILEQHAPNEKQPDFEVFIIRQEWEKIPAAPPTATLSSYTVKVSGNDNIVPGYFSSEQSKLVGRIRHLTKPPYNSFSHIKLYRNFIAAKKLLTVQVSGLTPEQRYSVRIYSCDLAGVTQESRAGSVAVYGASDGDNPTRISWNRQTTIDASTSPYQQTATISLTADDTGAATFSVRTETDESPILNGFELLNHTE